MKRLDGLAVLVVLLVVPLGTTSAVARNLGSASEREAISISVKDGDLAEVLRLLARVGRFNLVLDPSVSGRTITLDLEGVPWDQAMDIILTSQGFASQVDGNVIRVAPAAKLITEENQRVQLREAREQAGELRTIAVPLSNANAAQAEAIIRKSLTPRGTTSVDRRTNTIFITDVFPGVERGVKRLSLAPRFEDASWTGVPVDVDAAQAASFDVRLMEVEESLDPAGVMPSSPGGARVIASARLVLGIGQGTSFTLGEDADGNAVRLNASLQRDGGRVMLVIRAAGVDAGGAGRDAGVGMVARALSVGEEHVIVFPRRLRGSGSRGLALMFTPR